jgi:hypothetical protein
MSSRPASGGSPRSRLFKSLQSMSTSGAGTNAAPELSRSLQVVVRSVTALVPVASQLRSVALASAQTPKNALSGTFSRSRRAAHTEAVSSIRGRLAHKLKVASGASSKSVASQLRSQPADFDRVQSGRPELSVPEFAFPVHASGLLRH